MHMTSHRLGAELRGLDDDSVDDGAAGPIVVGILVLVVPVVVVVMAVALAVYFWL
jgi:hypothetical protein